MVYILGISAFHHDSAACMVTNGEIVAAAQEERFTRIKHDRQFPSNAIRYCLQEACIDISQIDYVGFYEKSLLAFDRLLKTYIYYAPSGFLSFLRAAPMWMSEKLWIPALIKFELAKMGGIQNQMTLNKAAEQASYRLLLGDHHESHAASAFYPSPFEEAAILTIDGVGEWATSSLGVGRNNTITLLKEMRFPDSLGLFYSAFTYYLGFKVNSGEYKLMGLAPYGEPTYVSLIRDKLLDIREDGSIRLNPELFDCNMFGYSKGVRITSPAFDTLFGGPPRKPDSDITQREMDIARSVQVVTEEVILKMARFARQETGLKKLCMAGGVALNCVANGKILRERIFDDIWIQPAAGDAGGAVGVALAIWYRYLNKPRVSHERLGTWKPSCGTSSKYSLLYADGMKGACLGPRYSEGEVVQYLETNNYPYVRYNQRDLPHIVASLIADGNVIGIHHGRMEFGPRALGARSIIGDARSAKMQSIMNQKIKYRESFRPFAASVLLEYIGDWFDLDYDSPYMLLVASVSEKHRREVTAEEDHLQGINKLKLLRSDIPAVTHVDYSSRIQTVRREISPLYWEIISAFYRQTGCPVIINTSFNVRGEPIVCTPEDSYRCFMRTEIDILMLEACILYKEEQPKLPELTDWRSVIPLD
jgi:carbamoyltransferase